MHNETSMTLTEPTYLQRLLTSFTIPAYRWLWANSVFGAMRLITIFVVRGWLVLTITDSPFWVGAAPALRGLTQMALGMFAGVLLDRVNRRTALILAEIGASLSALTVGLIVLSGEIELWHILLASVFEGICISVRWPAINTMVVQTVGPERMLNASSTHMLGFNVGNIVASGVAGLLVAALGVGYGYLFGAFCGIISTVVVFFVQDTFQPATESGSEQPPIFQAIGEGLTYIRNHLTLLYLIILAFLMSLLGWANLSMLPVMARDVLLVDASGLGYLTATGAIGSLISTGIVASLGDIKNKIQLILFCGACTTVGILLFSASSSFVMALCLIFLMQAALMAFEVTITAMVLLITDTKMQGRVQGIYTQVFGFTWIGGALLGAIAEWVGVPIAIACGGLAIGAALRLMYGRLNSYDHS